MSENTGYFRRVIISEKALQQKYGLELFEKFSNANLESLILKDDKSVLSNSFAYKPMTLLIMFSPSIGWITPAEHGNLATRINEFYLHPIIGCQSKCSYCYLLSPIYQRNTLRFFVGIDDLFFKLNLLLSNAPNPHELLFCTGELADSLAEINLYPIVLILIDYFANLNGAHLELRTKNAKIDQILSLKHNRNTTIAFSVAPDLNVKRYEPMTSPLSERLIAAHRCQSVGYPVALKIEPIIPTQNWEKNYEDLISLIASTLDVNILEHISIGSLRWSKILAEQQIFKKEFSTIINQGDWIEYREQKYNGTLNFDERLKIYSKIRELLFKYGIYAPIYWSLEEPKLLEILGSNYC